MSKSHSNHYYRVVCSSGDAFYTKAKTATEFVLDPVFIQFMTLSIFMFTSLMFVLHLPTVPQIILFGASIVSTFFLLTVLIVIYIAAIRAVGIRTIYTPILILPLLVLNAIVMDYVLRIFDTSYIDGFNGIWEISIRTLIFAICLDILHGKFIAPKHGLAVIIDKQGNAISLVSQESLLSTGQKPPIPSAQRTLSGTAVSYRAPAPPDGTARTGNATNQSSAQDTLLAKAGHKIRVGKQTFDLEGIQYIKSEDHYLVLQKSNQSEMVRGQLREVTAQIAAPRGVQINRSAWISYTAILEVHETSKGQLNVLLSDGSIMRVANTRKMFFRHGCTQFAPDAIWRRGAEIDE